MAVIMIILLIDMGEKRLHRILVVSVRMLWTEYRIEQEERTAMGYMYRLIKEERERGKEKEKGMIKGPCNDILTCNVDLIVIRSVYL